MPHDLSQQRCLIAVFTLEGCGHCEEYVPRLEAQVERLRAEGRGIEMWQPGQPAKAAVLVAFYDLTNGDKSVQDFADRFQVQNTPTTLVLLQGTGAFKSDVVLTDSQIVHLLESTLHRAGA